jgi:hypothetical protein
MDAGTEDAEAPVGPDDEPALPAGSSTRRSKTTPWSRILLGASIMMPALAFGGVHPLTVVGFCMLVTLLWIRLSLRSRAGLVIPVWAALGVLAAGATFVQWLPLAGVRELFAPALDAMVDDALVGTDVTARPGLSVVPSDTGLEAARLLALTALFVAAAQLSWRVSAGFVAALGSAVALIGYTHEALGFDAIYGWYAARDVDRSGVVALLGTFVNPNHQSGLLLLGTFCGIAVAADQHAHGLVTADPGRVDRYGDRFLAAMAGVTLQIPALVLSLSRGALVAFMVLAPVAAVLALRRQGSGRRARRRRAERLSPARIMVLVGGAGLFLMVAQHGAWRELATLSSVARSFGETDQKITAAREAFGLLELSPVLGIGRGAFIDLFPAIRSQPTHALATHLECAPAAMLVEWGPWVGGALLVGFTSWWLVAFMWPGGGSDRNTRRVVLLGLLAVALQNAVDFSFEFLGVTAPAVALAGAMSRSPARTIGSRGGAWIGGGLLLGGVVLAAMSRPDSQLRREEQNAALLGTAEGARALLVARPLDGRLHGLLARDAAKRGDWPQAIARATTAVRLRPRAIDPWLILGVSERQVGHREAGDRAVAEGLARLHDPPSEQLLEWLLYEYPRPSDLAALVPDDPDAWRLLVDALALVSRPHADAVAAARAQAVPDDPEPLRIRFSLALQERNPGLALHHARLLRQLAPKATSSHLAVAQAYVSLGPERLFDARDALLEAIATEAFADLAERGRLEQELLAVYLDLGDDESLARAKKLLPDLLSRPANREARRRTEELANRMPRP